MIKSILFTKLSRQLAALVLVSFILSAGLYFGLSPLISNAVCAYYAFNPIIVQQKADEMLNTFDAYVRAHNIAVTDSAVITKWVERHPLLIMQIHRDDQLMYDSTLISFANLHTHLAQETTSTHQMCQIATFSDGPASVSLTLFPEHTTVDWMTKALFCACGLLFLTIVLLAVRRKVEYLVRLEHEVLAIAGGDLQLPLTIQGTDELAMLAECIDEMRSSLTGRIRQGEVHGQEGPAIIAALSHDLRTPLTSLCGYLEVLRKHDLSEAQRAYVAKCIQKAAQIKEISDLLFSGLAENRPPEEQVSLSVAELSDQWIADYVEELTAKGFHFERTLSGELCNIYVQKANLRRVLDNVFANLGKYADVRFPVKISMGRESKVVSLVLSNTPRNDIVMSGSGLGLAICENLMQNMQGMFEIDTADGIFVYRLGWLPVKDQMAEIAELQIMR